MVRQNQNLDYLDLVRWIKKIQYIFQLGQKNFKSSVSDHPTDHIF